MSLYCVNNTDCATDAAVLMLGKMYGYDFIQAFITGSGMPGAIVPPTGTLAPILLGGISSAAMLFAIVLFFSLTFTALLNSAQDGEAFGKGSAKVTIVMRMLFSIVMLLPTPSGYSLIQVILMFFVLWSNGETNKLYQRVVSAALLSNTSLTSQKVDSTTDHFGLRNLALTYIKQVNCVNIINQVYKNTAPVVGSQWGTYYTGTEQSGIVSLIEQSTSSTDARNKQVMRYYTDSDSRIGSRTAPICGSIKQYITDPIQTAQDLRDEQKANSLINSSADNKAAVDALLEIKTIIDAGKYALIEDMFLEIDKIVAQYLPYDPLDQAGYNLKLRNFKIKQLPQLATVINNNVYKSSIIINGGAAGKATAFNDAMNKLSEVLVNRGWTYASGIRQRVAKLRTSITKIIEEPVYELTSPALDVTRLGSAQQSWLVNESINVLVPEMLKIFRLQYPATPSSRVDEADAISNVEAIASAEEFDVKAAVTEVDTSLSQTIAKFSRYSAMMVMTGEDKMTNANPLLQDDSNIDVLLNIQRTGEWIIMFQTGVQALKATFETTLTATGAVGSLVGGIRVYGPIQLALGFVRETVGSILTPLLSGLFLLGSYMAVVIPSIPSFFFITAIVAWYIHILQAMAGLPLWVVMHMIPERTFVGSQAQGYVTVLGLFLRPILTLVGLWFGYILANPILIFVTDTFFGHVGELTAATSSNGFALVITQAFTLVAWFAVYCTLVTAICYTIFGLSGTLPDSVLKWIGSGLSSGDWGASDAKSALVGGATAANNADAAAKKGGGGGSGGGAEGGDDGGADGGNNPNSPISPTNTSPTASATATSGSNNKEPTGKSTSGGSGGGSVSLSKDKSGTPMSTGELLGSQPSQNINNTRMIAALGVGAVSGAIRGAWQGQKNGTGAIAGMASGANYGQNRAAHLMVAKQQGGATYGNVSAAMPATPPAK